jgi:acetyltransferase-like isoleucine patch superfamily enzyme
MLLKMLTMLLPWKLRRVALNKWFGYSIHPTARIGLSWIFPKQLVMAEQTRIDHFTVAVNLLRIEMKANSKIGRSNWITGFPQGHSRHFTHQPERQAVLTLGESSAITKHHHIDCTTAITIGAFSTIAGYYSQLLTHSINVIENRQDSEPIFIGDYTFIGTNVVILGGSSLPAFSVLGAKSLLNKAFTEEWFLYGGVPAKGVQPIPRDAKYFSRHQGFVN